MFILSVSCLSLLALSQAQSFPEGYSYDFSSIPTLTPGCQDALNTTVQCSWLLPTYDLDSIDLTSENLTTVCTTSCSDSLSSTRKTIDSACPISSNQIVVEDIAYPATETIDRLIDTYSKLCLKESGSNDFCYDVMRAWQSETELTPEQSCSDCLLDTLRLDQSSPFSFNGDFASNFSSLTSSCGKTGFEPSKPTPIALNSSSVATATPTAVCASTYTVQGDDTCNGICQSHNVSTYSLMVNNQLDAYCRNFASPGTQLCMPPPCDIYTVQTNDTCQSIAAKQPSYITITQLQAWNPNLNGLCTNMEQQVDMQICVSPPNSTLANPTNTGAAPTAPTTPVPVPTTVANGTNTQCGKYYLVQPGDTCGDITIRSSPGISLSDFYFLNKGINENCTNLYAQESYCVLPVGDITTYPGYGSGYGTMTCTGEGSPSTCYSDYSNLSPTPFTRSDGAGSSTGSSTNSASATPTFTQLPMASGSYDSPRCGTFATYVDTGDDDTNNYANSCSKIADFYGIDTDSLTTWNPSLSSANPCQLATQHRYCVGLNGTSTTASATASTTVPSGSTTGGGEVTTPTPTQDGMTANCDKFYKVQSGDGCYDIAADNNISLDDFYSYNPGVGNDCSKLYPDYYVCVHVSASETSTTTTTSTTEPSSTTGAAPAPGPTQSGIIDTCNKYAEAAPGGNCPDFASDNGITTSQLYAWNSVLGPNGENCQNQFWGKEYYCVGVRS
ncbi:carbohydrate-binding module family 50 protein [Polychaeton citri CBS 116435]|uniref:Carbohydrate-binding module family 50 protein n=1 Tax=Polychaeton citri CBS 116435 TaxID=1314669 RepID=A0A9P4USJ9_9PEZI|nr:carbohydrate-binding module family 50 protein [Polychaeton citri CBS 116435]